MDPEIWLEWEKAKAERQKSIILVLVVIWGTLVGGGVWLHELIADTARACGCG